MLTLPPYPKVYNIGHPDAAELFDGPVVVQEKVDGSQFSFGVIAGELKMRSKGAEVYPETVQALFAPAAQTVRALYEDGRLPEGAVFRAEALFRPRHNTLAYERVPTGGLVLFDATAPGGAWQSPTDLAQTGEMLGLEVVPVLHVGAVKSADELLRFLERTSFLGGPQVEGVVVKNYGRANRSGLTLMGKHVSEAFREAHKVSWPKRTPAGVVDAIVEGFNKEAVWTKAVQRMREQGLLEGSPRDIGLLLKDLSGDLLVEQGEVIKERLFKVAWPKVSAGVARGFADWYKQRLLEDAFE